MHTKALRLVTQAGYAGEAKNQVLRDTIISGLTSDKIRAKIVKEGHAVTLNQVMEIARLEVSTQQHLERMQETAKVNYVSVWQIHQGQEGEEATVWCRGRWPQGLQTQWKRQQKVSISTRHLLQMWER